MGLHPFAVPDLHGWFIGQLLVYAVENDGSLACGEEPQVVCCFWRILEMMWQVLKLDSCESLRCSLASPYAPTAQLGVATLVRDTSAAWGRPSRAWRYVSNQDE